MMGLAGIGSLGACADPVLIDPIPDGGPRADMTTDGPASGAGLWTANPALSAALISEGPQVDAKRRFKRDPHYFTDSAGTQYLFLAGSDYNTEAWSVSYFTQPSGAITITSPWTSALVGTAGTWYSGDITGPAIRYTPTEKTLFFAANAATTDVNRNRPDYVFQIGRAPFGGTTYLPGTVPVISVAFTGSGVNDTPVTARPDAYGAMDPWILDDPSAGTNVVMYYTGLDCASGTCKFQILRATSSDGGVTFPTVGTVVLSGRANNPEEAGGVAAPSVVLRNGQYVLAYTAVKTVPTKSKASIRAALTTGSIDVAVSKDGITFTNASGNGGPVITRVGNYREFGCSSPSLYLDSASALHSYFTGYFSSTNSESYNLGTADWTQSQ